MSFRYDCGFIGDDPRPFVMLGVWVLHAWVSLYGVAKENGGLWISGVIGADVVLSIGRIRASLHYEQG